MSDDGIEVRVTSWATFSAPRHGIIDMSHLSDEEFEAAARAAVGDGLAERLERSAESGKAYRIARVDR
jgi:hypothetical protein